MFGKLFGKKKNNKPESFEEAKDELLESIREESQNKKIGDAFDNCLVFFTEENKQKINDLLAEVYELTNTLALLQSVAAMSICTSIIERGYYNGEIIDKLAQDFRKALNDSKPFFDMLHEKVKLGENGELDEDIDVDSLYHELLSDRSFVSETLGESVTRVEHFSKYIIAIVSVDSSFITKYKPELKGSVSFVKDYIQGCYWLDRLFNLLFDEAIVVIDVDNHVGFEGKMSGVSDNYQLQHLLMGMPELSDPPVIGDLELTVANGTGVHISNSIIESKWNMYNHGIVNQEDWEAIKIGPAKTYDLQDFWIWGEGTPHEIAVHNEKRVVLLGRSPIKRTTRLQRTFKNVKANIEVEKTLSEEEINKWLQLSN